MPFPFKFNGNAVSGFKISSSGVLTFDTKSTVAAPSYTAVALPSATIPDSSICISGLVGKGANDLVIVKTFGKAPNRQFWLQFNSYGYGTVTSDGSNFTYWGIVLEETSNAIYVVDQRTGGYASTKLVSVGVQLNATTAISVEDSPALASLATADPTPEDNLFYTFRFGQQPSFDMATTKITVPGFPVLGENIIEGSVKNFGIANVTSYNLNYRIDGGATFTDTVKGVNIKKFDVLKFAHTVKWNASVGGHILDVWTSNLNGNPDENVSDDTLTKKLFVISKKVQRKPLYEIFTSSTCGPCTPGNINFHNIVDTEPQDDFVAIKYQQNFPGTGDPYATTEAINRRGFYAINSIPRMQIDGGWNNNAQAFTGALHDNSRGINAQFVLDGTYTIDTSKTVVAKIKYTPLFDVSTAKLYVAIIENKTTKNVKSNGEKEFDQVMKKMLPTEAGTVISNKPEGVADSLTLSYKFVGKYRLPVDGAAANIINHTLEHSVEEFSDLRVIAWVQGGADKQVYQAANLSLKAPTVSDKNLPINIKNIVTYPNPASDFINIKMNVEREEQLTLVLIGTNGSIVRAIEQSVFAGENQLQINTADLSTGMYYLSIMDSRNNSHTEGIMIAK